MSSEQPIEARAAVEAVVPRVGLTEEVQAAIRGAVLPPRAASSPPPIDSVVSAVPEAERAQLGDLVERMQEYAVSCFRDGACTEFWLPPTLSRGQRKALHGVFDAMGLETHSVGWGKRRFLAVSQPAALLADSDVVRERFVSRGWYVALEGPYVDHVAAEAAQHEKVTEARRHQRRFRDGTRHHHITLVARYELATIREERKELFGGEEDDEALCAAIVREAGERLADTWTAVGLGCITEGQEGQEEQEEEEGSDEKDDEGGKEKKSKKTGNSALFVVVDWPEANEFRAWLGLPAATFHITVGFDKNDIHKVRKDRSTLIDSQ